MLKYTETLGIGILFALLTVMLGQTVSAEPSTAEAIYRAARRQGHVASLLTQERPNVFTQKVATTEPGKTIDVEVTYFNTLVSSGGSYGPCGTK